MKADRQAELTAAQRGLEELLPLASVVPFGSTAIYGEGVDLDFLIWSPLIDVTTVKTLEAAGFVRDSDADYGDFVSLRKGDINAVLCLEKAYFEGSVAGVRVCQFLAERGIRLDKKDRIRIHEITRGEE